MVLSLLVLIGGVWAVRTIPFSTHVFRPENGRPEDGRPQAGLGEPGARATEAQAGAVPLDPASPWPKFRADALQTGRSRVEPVVDPTRRPWSFQTGKGVFSSPVIDADGTAYVGSADHVFYAIDRDGTLRWSHRTGEVIDSSALLDDRGRVYFGSGDAHVYALERESGKLVWRFAADTVEAVEQRYGIESFNVDWFEGNVAMLGDGTLLVPNDNFLIYALDRDTGEKRREFLGNELMWSLPAVNPRTGRIFAGSQYMLWKNVFAYDAASGKTLWTNGGWGSNAASPLLTSDAPNGALVLGGFDGYVRAYAQDSGKQLWKRGLRGHLYASPAQLSDGTLIQASTDGTVYALEPETGRILWAYDTLAPIRSSPAVDAQDRIYVGSGQGELLSLDPAGTLRWSYRAIDEPRNDLNSSPALGPYGITVAGENGGVFHVPWDYPLTPAGRDDPRVTWGLDEALPRAGVFLVYTEPLGGLRLEPPAAIAANQPLTFTLFRREANDTHYAALDPEDLDITVSGAPPMRVEVSADRQFVTLVPQETWTGPEGGSLRVAFRGSYRSDPWRLGLKSFGGRKAGGLAQEFQFDVPARRSEASPYRVPQRIADPGTVFELSRLAAPNPTMLPSWNQIGFDSLHYLAGLVAGDAQRALVWVIAGRLAEGRTVVDPAQGLRFPLWMEYDGGLLTFRNDDGFKINFVGSWDMPFGFYRASTRVDPVRGVALEPAALVAVAHCNELEYYGRFLQLMGMADLRTGHMAVFGGLDVDVLAESRTVPKAAAGAVAFSRTERAVTATITGGALAADAHVFSLLLVDAASGEPLPLYYTKRTHVRADAAGRVREVRIEFEEGEVPPAVRAYYLVDTQAVARADL
jgi:outer membrane protein assembly factor BamB